MKRLHFSYRMQIEYEIPVSRCNFTIKCIPTDTLRQKITNLEMSISPAHSFQTGSDGLGNRQIYGMNEIFHKKFVFQIQGEVQCEGNTAEEKMNDNLAMIFVHPHGHNVAGPQILRFYKEELAGCKPNKPNDTYDTAVRMMHALFENFEYKQWTTNVNTSAEEAFVQGHGVCQDYAHIYIALLHLAGIPARYVTGLIVGEGESHAWVEILHDEKWYGLDPTHDRAVTDEYIRIGIGRDAKDCMINRGIMHGGGPQKQTIQVSVSEIKEEG